MNASWNYYNSKNSIRNMVDCHTVTSIGPLVTATKVDRAGFCKNKSCDAYHRYFKKDWCPGCGSALFWTTVNHKRTKSHALDPE